MLFTDSGMPLRLEISEVLYLSLSRITVTNHRQVEHLIGNVLTTIMGSGMAVDNS